MKREERRRDGVGAFVVEDGAMENIEDFNFDFLLMFKVRVRRMKVVFGRREG